MRTTPDPTTLRMEHAILQTELVLAEWFAEHGPTETERTIAVDDARSLRAMLRRRELWLAITEARQARA